MTEGLSDIVMRPIGIIRSPHHEPSGTPIQPAYAEQVVGEVVVDEDLERALADIEGFERIWLIYCFDRADARLAGRTRGHPAAASSGPRARSAGRAPSPARRRPAALTSAMIGRRGDAHPGLTARATLGTARAPRTATPTAPPPASRTNHLRRSARP